MTVILVEGLGDARAVPILLGKNGKHQDVRCIDMRGKSNIVRMKTGFEETIKRQLALGAEEFVILLDRDVSFPPYASLHQEEIGMRERSEILQKEIQRTVRVFWAIRAYESWLIGGLRRRDAYCGLKRFAGSVSGDTQASPEHPKEWLKQHLSTRDYNPWTQVCLTKNVDWGKARRRNRSLRDFLSFF